MKPASTENMSAKSKAIKVSFEPIFPVRPRPEQMTLGKKLSNFLNKFKGAIQRT